MKHTRVSYKICLSTFLLILSSFVLAQEPNGYYDLAQGLSGEGLKKALYDIIKGHTEFPYTASSTDVWDILKHTDCDTVNSENVILFYSGWSVNAAQEYNSASGWTREQVWAKSHGDFGTGKGAGTDVHHIRPVDLSINSARSNKDFDWGGSLYKDGDGPTECYSDADSWEPRDVVKGDVARMLFYMVVRYEGENGEPDLELIDNVNTSDFTEPGKGFHGKLATLLEWHDSDSVDSFEIRRNEIIYSYQNNRNPFIDHPEFAKEIWTVTGADIIAEKPYTIFPNPAKGFIFIDCTADQSFEVHLISMEGETLLLNKATGNIKLSIAGIPGSLYFLKIIRQNDTFTEKIVIQQ